MGDPEQHPEHMESMDDEVEVVLAPLLSPLLLIIFWIMPYTASRDLFYETP